MKLCSVASISLVLLLAMGCANQYVITMTNGATARASTKPRLDAQGFYVFKDTSGKIVRQNAMRVRSIEAVSRGESAKLPFER